MIGLPDFWRDPGPASEQRAFEAYERLNHTFWHQAW